MRSEWGARPTIAGEPGPDPRPGCVGDPALGFLAPDDLFWTRIHPTSRGGLVEELERIRRERNVYLCLLDLDAGTEIEPFLRRALEAIVSLTEARLGYLELRSDADDPSEVWWMAHGCSGEDVERIREACSRGIVAEAIATGRTIATHSALLDDRFRHRESVQRERIEAVICAPVAGETSRGVVHLQGRRQPGPFSADDRAAAERFARHLAPLAEALLARRRAAAARDSTLPFRARYRLKGIIGRSRALADALESAMLAAPLDVNVFLLGESGTGKSQLARAIHENSPRARAPFVELNCAAIPSPLVESELFGARAGAHSEARADRPGKVAAAEGGTLFLDEVAELPLEAQAKLLQLLQSRSYYPLGATGPIRADIRLVAATNADPDEALRERKLREDLYYRLQVLSIRVPALRERREDIAELTAWFCDQIALRHRLPRLEPSPALQRALEAAAWPGNVRQLEHALEAGIIRAAGQGAERLEPGHLFPGEEGQQAPADDAGASFQEATRRFQRELVSRMLRETDWNVAEAARRLDLARSHVYNLIKAFGLTRDDPVAR